MFSKTSTFFYFYIPSYLPILSSFFSSFFPSPQPHFHKRYLQSKKILQYTAVPNSAVFCSNAVFITTASCSMQFFSLFDVLPSAPTTTEITLTLLMFHFLLISLIPGISQFFPSLFCNSYVSRYSNIIYGTTSPILFHYSNIWFP